MLANKLLEFYEITPEEEAEIKRKGEIAKKNAEEQARVMKIAADKKAAEDAAKVKAAAIQPKPLTVHTPPVATHSIPTAAPVAHPVAKPTTMAGKALHDYSGVGDGYGTQPDQKDIMRLEDIRTKAGGDPNRVRSLARQMASAIHDKDKAMRRAKAALKVFGVVSQEFAKEIHDIFTK